MSVPTRGLALAVAGLLLVGLSSPAAAGGIPLTDGDATAGTADTNVTLDAEASVDGGATPNGTTADADAQATISTDDATLDAETGLSASATTDLSTLSLDATLEADTDGLGHDRLASDVAGQSTGDGAAGTGPVPDETPAVDTADVSGDTGDSGSSAPGSAPFALGLVAVAGAAAVRHGSTVASLGPPLDVRTRATVAVDWIRAKLPKLVPVAYSRYDDSDPLEHDVRAALYEAVEDSPGIHLSALERRTDVSLSSVRHHLRILEVESLVETERHNGKRRYFPAGTANRALVSALEDPAKAAVLRAVADREPASVSDLAGALDRDPSTISYHLSGLAAEDLVDRERDGRAVRARLTPGIRAALEGGELARTGARAD